MMVSHGARVILSDLVACEASGELICVSDKFEVHVYFQRGRIAWATDSTRPLAFTRYLLETAKIDPEIFREILESCRREKRPLGETLHAYLDEVAAPGPEGDRELTDLWALELWLDDWYGWERADEGR